MLTAKGSNLKLQAAANTLLECKECGQLHRLPATQVPARWLCSVCQHRLHTERPTWLGRCTALTLTGLVLFTISNIYPFISMEMTGLVHQTHLLSGVTSLWANERALLAVFIFLTIFLFPLLELLCLGYVLSAQYQRSPLPGQRVVIKMIRFMSQWNLLEVFLLGVLISAVKLTDVSVLVPGIALLTFALLVFVLIAIQNQLDYRALWATVDPHNEFKRHADEAMVGCDCCQARVGASWVDEHGHCPRCHSGLHHRIPGSLQKTAAYLTAALVLYIPANTLPIMITSGVGGVREDTIMSGLLVLWNSPSWPLAIVVLVASVFVPIAKILVLSYLWYTARFGVQTGIQQRMSVYRLTDWVGHWSMVDVYVVILTVALVKFGVLADVEAGGAALAFGGVVVFTLLAAQSFDPRLMWDAVNDRA